MGWLKFDQSRSVLGSLQKIWANLRDWDAMTFLQKMREFFDGELDPTDTAKIKVVIQALGLEDQVQKIGAVVAKIPQSAWQLFTPLSQLNHAIELPLLDEKRKFNPVTGPWGSSLGFDLASNIGIQAFSARQNVAMVPALKVPAGEAYLQLNGLGRLHTEVLGSLAFTGGSLSASLRAGGQVALGYLFSDKPKTLVITSLLDHAFSLCPPFDLSKIGMAYKKHMRAILFQAQGQLQLGAGLTVGQTWGTTVQVDTGVLGVTTPIGLSAAADVGVNVDYKLNGGFDLLIQPTESGLVDVQLQRSKNRTRTIGLNLNAQIAVSGLDVIGNEILKKYVPDARPLIDQLTPYLQLGTLLRGKLSQSLGGFLAKPENQTLRNQLVNTLTGVGSSEDLTQALLKIIQDQANNQLGLWQQEGQQAGQAIITKVADELSLPENARQLLMNDLVGELSESLADIKKDLGEDLKKWLAGKPKNQLEKLLKPLEEFGAKVNKWVNEAQDLVNKILKPVLDFLNQYQTYRDKIQKAVNGAARLKLGLGFSRSLAATKAGDVMLKIQLDPQVDEAREFFRQILWGSFSSLMTKIQAASSQGGTVPGVQLKGGTFSAQLGKTIQTNFSIDFAGKVAGTQTLRDLQLEATWDLAGNIQTAIGKTAFKRSFRFLGESRSASFVNVLELAGAGKQLANKIFSSSVSLTFRDEDIHLKEIRKLLGSLERSHLIPAGTVEQAITHYDAMDHQHAGAAIGLSMPLSGDDLAQFLKQTQNHIILQGFHDNLMIFHPKPKERNAVLAFMNTRISGDELLDKIQFILAKAGDPFTARDVFGGNSIKNKTLAYQAWTYSRNAKALANMQKIMQAVASISLVGPNREANLKKVYQLLDQFNGEVKIVLKVRKWLGAFGNDSVPKSTLAFMVALRALSKGDGEPLPLLPVIRWAEDGKEVESIII